MEENIQKLKERNCQPSVIYPAKLSFRYERERKAFSDKHKLREFTTTRLALLEFVHRRFSTVNKKMKVYKTVSKVTNRLKYEMANLLPNSVLSA